MKTISDTLSPLVEEWSDPGDYPNAVAAGPLPSQEYLAGVEGELKLELTDQEMLEMEDTFQKESFDFWIREVVDYRLPDGVGSAEWQIDRIEGNTITLSITDVEADPDYNPKEDTRW